MLLVDILVVCVSDAEFRNTGLERSEALKKDLEWFRQQGHTIPEPSDPGTTYSSLLEELSEKDPQAFICHFYNVYFAHTAGGRMIGKKVNRPTPLFRENDKYWVYDIMSEHYFGIHNLHRIDIFRIFSVCLMSSIKSQSMLMHFLLNMIPCVLFSLSILQCNSG